MNALIHIFGDVLLATAAVAFFYWLTRADLKEIRHGLDKLRDDLQRHERGCAERNLKVEKRLSRIEGMLVVEEMPDHDD